MEFLIDGGPRDGEAVSFVGNLAGEGDATVSRVVGDGYIGWASPKSGKPGVIAYAKDRSHSDIAEKLGEWSPSLER